MKKLLFCLAASSVLFACDKGDNNDNGTTTEIKKLPSKATSISNPDTDPSTETQIYTYDDQNHLTKLSWIGEQERDNYSVEITYGSDNKPTKIAWSYSDPDHDGYEETFSYSGDIVSRDSKYGTDFIKINSTGQMLMYWDNHDGEGYDTIYFSYDANGNYNEITYSGGDDDGITLTYSDTRAMFRHVNTPDWLFYILFDVYQLKSGYMLSQLDDDGELDTFTYVSEDGYVKTRTWVVSTDKDETAKNPRAKRSKRAATKATVDYTETTTFEYVNAK